MYPPPPGVPQSTLVQVLGALARGESPSVGLPLPPPGLAAFCDAGGSDPHSQLLAFLGLLVTCGMRSCSGETLGDAVANGPGGVLAMFSVECAWGVLRAGVCVCCVCSF
jgi:hypothetical protein